MRVSATGRVTIPKRIRDSAGLLPGTNVEFAVEGATVRIFKVGSTAGRRRGERVVELLRNAKSQTTWTTDEIMALTRDTD